MLRTMQTINADTGKRKNVEPYEELANGIVLQAVDDYKALKCGRIPTITEEQQLNMKKSMELNIIADQKKEIINFFNSKWFSILTTLKPKVLIDYLNSLPYKHWKPTFQYVSFNCKKFAQLTKDMETKEIQSKILETSKKKMSKDQILIFFLKNRALLLVVIFVTLLTAIPKFSVRIMIRFPFLSIVTVQSSPCLFLSIQASQPTKSGFLLIRT